MLTELKICGLTTVADLRLCERLGADWVGMVVEVARSPRAINRDRAHYLCRASVAKPVLVVADLTLPQISEIADVCQPAVVQIHEISDPGQVQELRDLLPQETQLWLALGLPPAGEDSQVTLTKIIHQIERYADCGGGRIVLDTRVQGQTGGTGVPADWTLAAQIVKQSPLPVMLAGGLTPDNVAEAVRQVQPAGVDISSGAERSPGRKDPSKLRQLCQAVGKA